MKERIVKIVDYGTFIGFPIRVSCLILVAGVALSYGFVLYFLPTPYCWILIGVQSVACIVGIVGAVSCFQLFTKLYLVLQAVLVIPIAVIFGYVIHVVIYYSEYSCSPNKCRQSYYKGWLHDQGLLLLWIVMIVAVAGTGLLGLTLLGFKKLISHQSHTHGMKDHNKNCANGCGNQTCQPIQQNPQTNVVINQSMPMMGGQMGGQMPGFMQMPMMMQQPNPMQSNMFTIPMGFPPMQQTTTTGTQNGQPMMMNPQFPMQQFYPWFNPMAMMQAQQAGVQMTVPAQVHTPPAENPVVPTTAPTVTSVGIPMPTMCSAHSPTPIVENVAVQKAAPLAEPVAMRTLAPCPEIETASMADTASVQTFSPCIGEDSKPIPLPSLGRTSIAETIASTITPFIAPDLVTVTETAQTPSSEPAPLVEITPTAVNPEVISLVPSLEHLVEPVPNTSLASVSNNVILSKPVVNPIPETLPNPNSAPLVRIALEPTAPLETLTPQVLVKTRPSRTCSL